MTTEGTCTGCQTKHPLLKKDGTVRFHKGTDPTTGRSTGIICHGAYELPIETTPLTHERLREALTDALRPVVTYHYLDAAVTAAIGAIGPRLAYLETHQGTDLGTEFLHQADHPDLDAAHAALEDHDAKPRRQGW